MYGGHRRTLLRAPIPGQRQALARAAVKAEATLADAKAQQRHTHAEELRTKQAQWEEQMAARREELEAARKRQVERDAEHIVELQRRDAASARPRFPFCGLSTPPCSTQGGR